MRVTRLAWHVHFSNTSQHFEDMKVKRKKTDKITHIVYCQFLSLIGCGLRTIVNDR
jgi:hypothetical protein